MRSSRVVKASDFLHWRPLSPSGVQAVGRDPPSSARAEAAVILAVTTPAILTPPELQTRVRAATANGPLHSIFSLRLCHSLNRCVWFKRGPSARGRAIGDLFTLDILTFDIRSVPDQVFWTKGWNLPPTLISNSRPPATGRRPDWFPFA